jgi:F-box interacting protein
MEVGSNDDDQNDVALSLPPKEETPTAKRERFSSTTETPSSQPSSSNPLMPSSDNNSVHAPPLPTLPFELIVEILCLLPVKFLWNLRSVCKSWKSLISDPKFAKKHLRGSQLAHVILSFTNPSDEFLLRAYPLPSIFNAITASVTQLRYPLNNRNHYNQIVGSCDGIICFSIDQYHSLLWNPSIGKFKKLRSLRNHRRKDSYTMYGFGHDHLSDSYKVVVVFCCESLIGRRRSAGYKTKVKVHTPGTNYWRRIKDFPPCVPFNNSGKFVSGTLNWPGLDASGSSFLIISLDLGNESYQEFLPPDYGGKVGHALILDVLRDCLCIFTHIDIFSEVWIMKEYGNRESWTKLFGVPFMGNIFSKLLSGHSF